MYINPKFRLLAFNHDNMDEAQAQKIYDLSVGSYNLLILKGDEVIGFIICMREGSAYGSENYKFFTKKLKKFLYVDRVAIDEQHRRAGLGQVIYKDIFKLAKKESLPIALEVNTQPINQPSLDFHKKMGFDQVGVKDFDDHSVAYFIKQLL